MNAPARRLPGTDTHLVDPLPAGASAEQSWALMNWLGDALRRGLAAAVTAPAPRHEPEDIIRAEDMARYLQVDRRNVGVITKRLSFLKSLGHNTWMYQQVLIWKAYKVGMPLVEAEAEWERFRNALKRKARTEPAVDGKRRG